MTSFARGASGIVFASVLAAGVAWAQGGAKGAKEAEAMVAAKCASCHERTAQGGLARVSEQRKTPEGWLMTLRRMEMWHGVQLTPDEERVLLKHLSDTLGLAPAESAPFRYALEQRPGTVETPDDADLATFCARCHTYARVGLQRRDAHEWKKLVHMHLGQWPTLEYQAMSRDRPWWALASTEVAAKLGEKWPMQTPAWTEWRKKASPDLSGTWRIGGERPGKGQYEGRMTVKRTAADAYSVGVELSYADGSTASGKGSAVVYTGYEWRGTVSIGKETVQQVFAVADGGSRITGRWFLEDESAIGGDLRAVREKSAGIVSVQPPYIRAGETAKVTIAGAGLSGAAKLGDGVTIVKTVAAAPDRVVVEVRAAGNAAPGARAVSVGKTTAETPFVVFDKVDAVRVEPALDVARTGGGGGPIPPVPTQFQAVGYLNGPDGKPATDDDVRIGVMPARWSLGNFDAEAEHMKDAEFGGSIDGSGLFTPAAAGINPDRGLFNNYANLTVKAKVGQGGAEVEGSAHLFVAPQRWNSPPIL
ncbi:MAG TPA: quinohemoprotein amine dehydrogenase subunit alpha [Azospirillum sp.]|nr:quinohemoprotein amine dehydrogenase subunit alpha [Azospirillum sp.]